MVSLRGWFHGGLVTAALVGVGIVLTGIVLTGTFGAGTVRADEAAQAGHTEAGHGEAGHGEAAHGAAGHGEHHASPTATEQVMEMLSIKADTAIWTAAVFLLLLAVLSKFAWGPIAQALEQREHSIAEHIASAEKAHRDAKSMLADYEKKLANVQDEVRAILDEARRDAEHTQQEILAKAQADAQTYRDRALREIETATSGALKELSERSAHLAVDLAGKLIRQRLSPADHSQLIADAVANFPQSSSRN